MAKIDRLLKSAAQHLDPGERVEVAVQGTYETEILGSDTVRTGVLMATDRRVVFYASKITGYELESFPYKNISSFEQGKNMMGGNVTFFASGNRVHLKWVKSKELPKLTQVVKERIHGQADPSPPIAPAEPDIPSQIAKLAELRDSGVLSEDEFQTKKNELLDRI